MCNCEDAPCCGCDQNELMTDQQIQDMEDAQYLDAYDDEFDDEQDDENPDDEPYEMSDSEADADTLRSCGWGNNEDYGGGYYDE